MNCRRCGAPMGKLIVRNGLILLTHEKCKDRRKQKRNFNRLGQKKKPVIMPYPYTRFGKDK